MDRKDKMIKALAITGPTASGKTALSIALAEELGCEIISCDSMQIYKGMDIGTAKATEEEQGKIKHHMLNFLSPTENYSAQSYRQDALAIAEDITKRGKIPLFVGGTGLYVDALVRGSLECVPESSEEYRQRVEEGIRTEEDKDALWQRLSEVDPTSAEQIHKNNVRRVIRALEIYDATGKPKSYFDSLSKNSAPDIKIGIITLDFHNRQTLYDRVDMRVDKMMEEGLLSEVRDLYESGCLTPDTTASQAIGYKEIIEHLKGEITLADAVELIKLSSRRYAKRQLTWFRNKTNGAKIYLDGEDGKIRPLSLILSEALNVSKQFLSENKDI